jgi:hypothetical protein
VRFLENPKIPLDTNGVERALRGVARDRFLRLVVYRVPS